MTNSRRAMRITTSIIALIALGVFFLIKLIADHQENALDIPEVLTGYSLFAIFIFLVLFNLRKRIAVIPQLGRAYWWHQLHIILGLVGILFFSIHTHSWWPEKSYEQWLVLFFYWVILSGILGAVIQYYLPKKIAENGEEVIFERVSDAVDELRKNVIQLIEKTVKEDESETLLQLYKNSLAKYFTAPSLSFKNLSSNHSLEFTLENEIAAIRQYCDDNELLILEELKKITLQKINIDRQYAHQLVLKLWLFIHIPAVTGLMLLTLWHLLLVNIYYL